MPNLNRNLFYDSLEELLQISNLDEKFAKFREFYSAFKEGKFNNFQRMTPPKPLFEPSYKQICNIVPIKQSSKIKSKNKEALFLHNIAHIEYSAIEIALDACYRFEMMPREFYSDWLEVASDEIRHFCMIESCLCKSGFKYGDFAVHDGLFVALKKTENSLIERMALLPRFMEANGLDANKFIIERLKKEGKEDIIALLEVILKEEVSHVYKGDKWFKWCCKKSGLECEKLYFDIILKHYPNSFSNKRELNMEARLEAGFSLDELKKIEELQERALR
ncbi:ferritin-like domain-containing protein [uncultured Campylobacter sp.]|uniref:ferritin-like domain-containing protein n=1 Tax=uncultured Campylobacter sp. TaxID=218934 RepID=UPI00261560B1|nr:ferritin-like domain-containing protein [uncultured Campylobacter sp.]